MFSSRWRRCLIFGVIAGLALVLASASPGSAEVRTLTATLPSDARPTPSGIPDNPDLRQLHIVYDTSGSLTITVDFWHPVNALDTSRNYAFYGVFGIGTAAGGFDHPHCETTSPGELSGQHHVFSMSEVFPDQASVVGDSDTVTFARSVSPDNTEITITASNPVLASHDWTCATYALLARTQAAAPVRARM